MATIAEIRAKYPQYADMPDAALADALHKKFYADMPRADFDAKIGLKPAAPSEIPAPRTGPTTYEKVREFVAPTVEALGAAGGAVLGTPLGPLGMVGGAGLGYGMAKEAVNLADIYLGGKKPREGAAAVVEPVRNVLEGATLEAGGRAAGELLAKGVGKVMDLRQLPQQKAAKIAQTSLGADLPRVINTLRNAPANASVAEITAGIENPTWQALVKDSLQKDPQFLRKMRLMDESESTNALAKLAGGTTAADVRATNELAKANLNTITGPMRESSLNRANLGKAVADYEAQAGKLSAEAAAEVQKVRRLIELGDVAAAAARLQEIKAGLPAGSRVAPAKSQAGFSDKWAATYTYPGKLAQMSDEWASQAANASLDLGQGARFSQAAADALRSVGIKPLEGAPLVSKISAISQNPSFAGNDLVEGAVKTVADDIAKWTSQGGVIDANALEAIRKNAVNAAIAKLRPGADATAQRNLAAGVMSNIKPLIDDAIESAGGAGWRDYLTTHAKGMRNIAEKKLTGEAAQLWKTNKDEFVRLVQNESPDAVEKILGPGSYNIAMELADSTLNVLQNQARKHLTQLSVKEQATEGQKALTQLLAQQTSSFRFPSWLNFWTTAGNQAISELERKIGAKSMKVLTESFKSPQGAANLLETLPGAERNRVLQLLSNPKGLTQKLTAPVAIGVRNALAPESQNALAP